MENIRFGIIGCGDVTEVKSGPAFRKVKGSDLEMVMRRDEEKLIDYAKRHQVERYTTDYKELLTDDSVDAVYIATPPKWHHYYALEAARHKKAVYVEKPMALTIQECQEMIDVCKAEGVPLYVAYYRRGQPKFNKVKALIKQGVIGDIRAFHYSYANELIEVDPNRSWLMDKEEAGGGLLYDIGSHMTDILLYFFGDLDEVNGSSANQTEAYGVDDVTSGYMKFKNGVQGTIQMTFNAGFQEDVLRILGADGWIELSIMNNEPVTMNVNGQLETFEFDAIEHVEQPFIQMVVDSMHGLNDLDTTGIEGLKTQKVLEALC